MDLKLIEHDFIICEIQNLDEVNIHDEFCFLSKTDNEYSLICTTRFQPNKVLNIQSGFKCLRIENKLEINTTGIIAKLSSLLALYDISLIAISTFNTVYLFVKSTKLNRSIEIFSANNYNVLK